MSPFKSCRENSSRYSSSTVSRATGAERGGGGREGGREPKREEQIESLERRIAEMQEELAELRADSELRPLPEAPGAAHYSGTGSRPVPRSTSGVATRPASCRVYRRGIPP